MTGCEARRTQQFEKLRSESSFVDLCDGGLLLPECFGGLVLE